MGLGANGRLYGCDVCHVQAELVKKQMISPLPFLLVCLLKTDTSGNTGNQVLPSQDLSFFEHQNALVIHLCSIFQELFLQRQYSLSCIVTEAIKVCCLAHGLATMFTDIFLTGKS